MAISSPDIVLKEKELFQDFQNGKLLIFDYFFNKYYQGLCVYAYRLLQSTSQAEDIVADFFVRILENRKNIRIDKSVKSYFIRSIHNRCLDYLAHQQVINQRREYLKNRSNEEDFQDDLLLDSELEERLMQVIQKLPDGIRETFILNRFEGLKYQQIAEKERVSVKTVEYRISKALGILRRELADYIVLVMVVCGF